MLCTLLLAFAAQDVVTTRSLLAELADPASLARWPSPQYGALQTTSRDPKSVAPGNDDWFANDDAGHFVRIEERDGRREAVMLDAEGPGAIVRIWSANPTGRLRIYLDGADEPAIDADMREFLTDRPRPSTEVRGPNGKFSKGRHAGIEFDPLKFERARGCTSFVPIPFAKRAVVTCDSPKGVYYHVGWRRYVEGTEVETFARDGFDDLAGEFASASRALRSKAAPGESSHSYSLAEPNPEGFLECTDPALARGPRAISQLDFLVEAPNLVTDIDALWLTMTFDGVRTVEVPFNALFANRTGVDDVETRSVIVVSPGRFVSRWVMPYRESFTFAIENRGSEETHIAGSVRTIPWKWDERSLYFHAGWRRSGALPTRPMRDWRHAELKGRGVLAGDALFIANPTRAWWGEGDEKIYVDGEIFPSHFGTGSEDYYGFAWCDPTVFQAPLATQPRSAGRRMGGHTTVARWRALDAIPFERSLTFDMEMRHSADCVVERDALVVWYGDAETRDMGPALSKEDQVRAADLHYFLRGIMLEAEDARVVEANGVEYEDQSIPANATGRWSKDAQLWVRASKIGDQIELEFPVDRPGRREVLVHPTQSWDYGIVRFAVDGRAWKSPFDGWCGPERIVRQAETLSLGHYDLGSTMRLRIELVGANEHAESPRTYFGLDGIELR